MDAQLFALMKEGVITADQCAVINAEKAISGRSVAALLLDCGFVDEDHYLELIAGVGSGVDFGVSSLASTSSAVQDTAGTRDTAVASVAYSVGSTVNTDTNKVKRLCSERAVNSISVLEIDVEQLIPDKAALAMLIEADARELGVLPVALDQSLNVMTIAVSEPRNIVLQDRLKRLLPSVRLVIKQAKASDIAMAIERCYGIQLALDQILIKLDIPEHAPVVDLVDAMLADAVANRASDIHLSPESCFFRIRHRIDGVLHDSRCIHLSFWPAILVRIKILSDMDIAETRLPQDGHLTRQIHGGNIDFRVSSFPVRTGENIVMRVLDRRRGLRQLEDLMLSDVQRSTLQRLVNQPDGMLIVCGPTGSGKTTTLYAMLNAQPCSAINIMTLEDPIEYPILRVRQTQIQNGKFDFADGVRGVLRQDPDVILIGEIRDSETCQMACRAAITGHQVLTSVHATDCVGALMRMLELGANPFVLSACVSGIVAQRLLRLNCQYCTGGDKACRQCKGAGFYGRTSLIECLFITPEFAQALQAKSSADQLRQQAQRDGMLSLQDAAKELVSVGLSSTAEVERVMGQF